MRGKIENLATRPGSVDGRPTFGFIRGEDGISRFFIPTGMQRMGTIPFDELVPGQAVEFTHIDHPKGPRAIEVRTV